MKNIKARDYLKNRSLDKDQVKKFRIGFVEKNPNLFEELKKKYQIDDLLETGLIYLDEKKNTYVERFRGRLIFPINDISGQPIALGGRIIEKSDFFAKYINSPETMFFKKGSNLYNLDSARKSLFSIILPPKAIGCPEILLIGKINLPLNLST